MLERLRGRGRFGLYAGLLSVLALLCGIAVWSVARTGAYLTDQGDWQYLGGDYRIGTVDYTVTINDELLMGLEPGSADVSTYKLVLPLLAGVRMFDPTLSTATLREREFNEGATLMRVQIVNRSDSMVEVHAAFSLADQTAAEGGALRVLPLPVDLDLDAARNLNYRQYVMDTLSLTDPAAFTDATESSALTALDSAYAAYLAAHPTLNLDAGIIPGAVESGYSHKDIFLLVWSEYGSGEYDAPAPTDAPVRQGQFTATFTVGQID